MSFGLENGMPAQRKREQDGRRAPALRATPGEAGFLKVVGKIWEWWAPTREGKPGWEFTDPPHAVREHLLVYKKILTRKRCQGYQRACGKKRWVSHTCIHLHTLWSGLCWSPNPAVRPETRRAAPSCQQPGPGPETCRLTQVRPGCCSSPVSPPRVSRDRWAGLSSTHYPGWTTATSLNAMCAYNTNSPTTPGASPAQASGKGEAARGRWEI